MLRNRPWATLFLAAAFVILNAVAANAALPIRDTSNFGTGTNSASWNLISGSTQGTVKIEVVCPNPLGETVNNGACDNSNSADPSQPPTYVFLYQVPVEPNGTTLAFSNLQGFTGSAASPAAYGVVYCAPANTVALCTNDSQANAAAYNMTANASANNLTITINTYPSTAGATLTFYVTEQLATFSNPASIPVIQVTTPSTVPSPVPTAANVYYVPHITFGQGFISKLTVVNTSTTTANVTINFISQAGALISTNDYTVPAAGLVRVTTPPTSQFASTSTTEWAAVGSSVPVGVNVFFEYNQGGGPYNVLNTVGFNNSPVLTDFTVPVDYLAPSAATGNGRTAGIALANPFGTSQPVILRLIDQNGNVVAINNPTLVPYGQFAVALDKLFTIPNGSTGFVGTMIVQAPQGISAITLLDNFGPFASTPPMVGRGR